MRALAMFIALSVSACGSSNEFAYSGTIEAESAAVGSTIGGRVVAVEVAAGQQVRARETLVTLDDSAQRAALAQARAQLEQAQAALSSLAGGASQAQQQQAAAQTQTAAAGYQKATALSENQIETDRQSVRQGQANAQKARAAAVQAIADNARVQVLYAQGAIPAQQRDAAVSAAKQAVAALAAARAQLATARSNLAATVRDTAAADIAAASGAYQAAVASQRAVDVNAPSQVQQARANADAARAAVAAALTRLREMTIRAPAGGIVQDLDLHAGDLVAPNASVATIQEFRDPFIRIYVAQTDLSQVKIGGSVRVRSDAFANRTFEGAIEQIDTAAQFTPQNVETRDDRAAVNFGVKIRVHDPDRVLRAGTTGEVALR